MYILIEGVAEVRWTEQESYRDSDGKTQHRSVTHSSHEQYLNSQTALFGQIEGPTVKLPAGEHTYQFACALPERLPGTMHSHEADIRYKVKLVMDVPWGIDTTKKQEFEVVNMIDLNQNYSLRMPVQLEEVKSFCLCSWQAQEAAISVTVPQGGYVPNEEIPVQCSITNKTAVPFEGVSFTLQRIVTAIAVSPRRSQRETKDDLAQCEHSLVPEETRNTATKFTGVLKVPLCPVSSHYAAYIHTDYVIKVEFRVVGCHSNVTMRLPIEIGTVPLGATGYAIANATPLAPLPMVDQAGGGHPLPSAPPPTSSLMEQEKAVAEREINTSLMCIVILVVKKEHKWHFHKLYHCRASTQLCRSDECRERISHCPRGCEYRMESQVIWRRLLMWGEDKIKCIYNDMRY